MREHGSDTRTRRVEGKQSGEREHVPVLETEVVRTLLGEHGRSLGGWIVDGTVGAGGHARALLKAAPGVRLLAIDQDPDALELARRTLREFGERVVLERARLSELDGLLERLRVPPPVGMLLDLGVSSMQLGRPERGFSFDMDGPLDMRMDPTRDRTAADVVNRWDESDLADLLYYEGGERRARQVARAIVEGRRQVPFKRTAALADVVARAVGGRGGKIHPATRTFQALRRAVNEEGEELLAGLATAKRRLAHGGRLAAISFHSGEDGVVKRYLAERARAGCFELLGRRPVEAGPAEVRANPRARSARLRAAVRVRPEGGDASAVGRAATASPAAEGDRGATSEGSDRC